MKNYWRRLMSDKTISEIIEGEKPYIFDCEKDSPEKCLKWIRAFNLIYIGETHYHKIHQDAEVEIIKAAAKRYKIQIAVEEFNTSQQEDINNYLAGHDPPEYFKEKENIPLIDFARAARLKVIAIDIPPEKDEKGDGLNLYASSPGREKYWAEILIPHLNKEIKTFVIMGGTHMSKYCGFPIRLARAGFEDYINIELKWDR